MSAQEQVQQTLDAATAAKDGVPGIVFGMMDKNGNWLARAASGVTNLAKTEDKMNLDAVFAIYSCTKVDALRRDEPRATLAALDISLTGHLIDTTTAPTMLSQRQLVEQGRLNLDDPAGKYVPEIDEMRLLDGSKQNKQITTRMLLSHTAGFSYTFFNEGVRDYSKENSLDEFDPGRWEDYKTPLIAQPGEDWNYGVNMDWAGKVLEAITGQTLGQYSKENIFDKVGCKELNYVSLFDQGALSRLASMHQRLPNNTVSPRDHFRGAQFDSAGAGCLGTLEDYLRCIVILVNEGRAANGVQILKPETVNDMWKDQMPAFPEAEAKQPLKRNIETARPDLANPVVMDDGMPKGWCISACLTKAEWPTGRSANSMWWAGLPNLFWMADRNKGVVNMCLSQIFPFGQAEVMNAWLGAEKAVYDNLK